MHLKMQVCINHKTINNAYLFTSYQSSPSVAVEATEQDVYIYVFIRAYMSVSSITTMFKAQIVAIYNLTIV